MIEKRQPHVSGKTGADDDSAEDAVVHDATAIPEDDDIETHQSAAAHSFDDDEEEIPSVADDDDIDSEAEAARRKRAGNMIMYGGFAVVALIIGVLAYPQFKKTFVKEAPKQQAAGGIPVPEKARQSKFSLAQTDNNAAPVAPAGAFAAPPEIAPPLSIPTSAPPSLPAPPLPATEPVAVAPPPVVTPEKMQTADATAVPSAPQNDMAAKPPVIPASPPVSVPSVVSPPVVPAPAMNNTAMNNTIGQLPPPSSPAVASGTTQPQIQDLQAHVADLNSKVAALQSSVTSLAADKDANSAQLKQIQSSLDSLQHQIADMAGSKKVASASQAVAAPRPKAVPASSRPHHPSSHRSSGHASGWLLRSATPGMALLGQPGSGDLQRASVGDTISGLGKILSISEHNGQWVVKGTSGSVVQ